VWDQQDNGGVKAFALAAALCFAGLATPAVAADEPDPRWGISIWGLSYHPPSAIDYADVNLGVGLRYYFNRHFFVEGDALRDSNRGLVLPVSIGAEIGLISFGQTCRLAAVGALTLAYYQNPRTESDYFKFGPVPGVVFGCHMVQVNVVAIFSPSGDPLAAIVASLTVRF
jgi:hypothetical protein